MGDKLIRNIVQQFKDIQSQEIWLDENFEKKIEGISADQPFHRPLPQLHSVAELISHLLEWRKESIRKLTGGGAKLRVESPENWRTNEELRLIGWEKLKSEFYNSQTELTELIQDKTDDYLENKYDGEYTFKYLIEGLIHHDLYHLGQIGITIKFLNLQ